MFYNLSEFERRELLSITSYWIRQIPPEEIDSLVDSVLEALNIGRQELGLPTPSESNALKGLLAHGGGLTGRAPMPVDDIELAFRLWVDRREPFSSVIQSAGLNEVFCVVGWHAVNDAWPASLIRLNGFLASALTFFAEEYRKDAARFFPAWRGLRGGASASAKKRLEDKKERRAALHTAAHDYRRQHPQAKNSDIAEFLAQRGFGTVSSITKFLSGNKKQFLKDMAAPFQRRERSG